MLSEAEGRPYRLEEQIIEVLSVVMARKKGVKIASRRSMVAVWANHLHC